MTAPALKPPLTTLAAARPLFPEEDLPGVLDAIADVLRGGRLILGPKTRELEAAWAARLGVKHAVAVSSCTAALEISYRFLGVEGREVLVPTNTFVATANAVKLAGGTPVFVDLDPRDYNLSVDDALAKLGPKTAAVVVVHIAGLFPHGLDRLLDACKQRGIPVVEDCAHAHGATHHGRAAGSLGKVGCYSFYPTKVLTCGVGGLVATDDDELATYARSLRHHGQGASLEEILLVGNDWVMDEVRAVLCLAQTKRLDDFLARRRAVAARYGALLAGDARMVPAVVAPGCEPAWYKYPVLLPEGVDREAVRKRALDEHRVELGALYSPPAHQMPIYKGAASLPFAERLLPRQICLPMHAAMTPDDADRAVAAVRAVL